MIRRNHSPADRVDAPGRRHDGSGTDGWSHHAHSFHLHLQSTSRHDGG